MATRIKTPWAHQPEYPWRVKVRAQQSFQRRQAILSQTQTSDETAATVLPLLEWSQQFRRLDDQPFTLDRFQPLLELYRDTHPQICVMKPAQVGISEYAINYAIYAMIEGFREWSRHAGVHKTGINVGYCFPTREALSDFSKERFGGLKRESDYFAALFAEADFDDVKFKQIKDSYLYLRGAWSVDALLSFPADLLILDEFDRMDRSAIELARKRLRQSVIRRQLCVSTPTLPGAGIDELYKQSDQREWEVLCRSCDVYSALDYFRDVRANDASYEEWKHWEQNKLITGRWSVSCPNCKKEIDRLGPGQWRATNPEATLWHGYHIPALCFPSVRLEELALLAVNPDPLVKTEFYRSDLGIPFAPADSRLTAAMLKQLAVDFDEQAFNSMKWTRTTMGVDVGAKLHYRIDSTGEDGRRYIRAMGAVTNWSSLSRIMEQYKVRSCVIDAEPELHKAKEWADTFKGRVKRATYPHGVAALRGKLFALGSSEERKLQTAVEKKRSRAKTDARTEAIDSDIVQINRTMAMDAVYTAIAEGRVIAPPSIVNEPQVLAEMTAPIRVVTKDDQGQERASWEHTTPDHFYHASVYCLIALEVMPRGVPGIIGQDAAKGWQPKR